MNPTLQDIKGIARKRFVDKYGNKYLGWAAGLMFIGLLIALFPSSSLATNKYVENRIDIYTIQSLETTSNGAILVNGSPIALVDSPDYTTTAPYKMSLIVLGCLVALFGFGVCLVFDDRKTKYTNKMIESWAESHSIPDLQA